MVVPSHDLCGALMKHTVLGRVERDDHRALNSSNCPPKETCSHSWLGTDQSDDLRNEGLHISSRIHYLLTFQIIYATKKPEARKLVFPPFHFLSPQPYRNSWVMQDKHTQSSNESRCIRMKKDMYEISTVCANSECSTCSAYKQHGKLWTAFQTILRAADLKQGFY